MKQRLLHTEILEAFRRVLNKYRSLEKIPIVFTTGDKLHRQEISAIQAIGASPGINVSALAQTLGVTKGTISPLATRLSKKGFINKFKGGDNDKEVLLNLTMKGERIYHENELLLVRLRLALFERYERENPQCLIFLKEFLTQAEGLLEKHYAQIQDGN